MGSDKPFELSRVKYDQDFYRLNEKLKDEARCVLLVLKRGFDPNLLRNDQEVSVSSGKEAKTSSKERASRKFDRMREHPLPQNRITANNYGGLLSAPTRTFDPQSDYAQRPTTARLPRPAI